MPVLQDESEGEMLKKEIYSIYISLTDRKMKLARRFLEKLVNGQLSG